MEGNDFGWALKCVRDGGRVMRRGWNGVVAGRTMYLQLQKPDEHSKMNHPYLYMTGYNTGEPARLVPWVASQIDILASDWEAAP